MRLATRYAGRDTEVGNHGQRRYHGAFGIAGCKSEDYAGGIGDLSYAGDEPDDGQGELKPFDAGGVRDELLDAGVVGGARS
ncbi:hypothetical protein [Virgisporangium aurantiacum]|uniref:Uncharacterized protein n=1 Tax=Virgisporangium aurantiacum TaxID=175570 RepID=A0A8J4E6S1_9ACTN|nr:hypothetical protein [Virgisporangium aurantiacum]GIJ63519.1 hypothetical protein Vau01_110350 [Virgisporangium aurantiacum]